MCELCTAVKERGQHPVCARIRALVSNGFALGFVGSVVQTVGSVNGRCE